MQQPRGQAVVLEDHAVILSRSRIFSALIVGAIAERMKFSSILVFVTLWMVVRRLPVATPTSQTLALQPLK